MSREIEVDGSYNARAVGTTSRPWLIRSAAVDAVTDRGETQLRALGVDLIIDLREPAEQRAPTHGLPIASRPIYGEAPPATGSLESVYRGLLEHRGEALTRAVQTIALHPGVPLVHCTAGKDRTGLVVALARLAAGDNPTAVTADYSRSGVNVRPARTDLVAAQLRSLDLDAPDYAESERLHLDSPSEALTMVIEFLADVEYHGHRGAAAYLLQHGMTVSALDALRGKSAERPLTLLHLSDIHATESGLLYNAADGLCRMRAAGEYAKSHGITADAIVITGDLIQRGNPGAYERVEIACQELEALLQIPVITVFGNHDIPAAATDLTGSRQQPYRVETVAGYRIIKLDSHTRSLGPEQRSWLAEVLAEAPSVPTVIALHHAPIGSPLPVLRTQELIDSAELMHTLRGHNVRGILAGHFHHTLTAHHAGIPIFVAPALAYHQDMTTAPGTVAGHDSPWFGLAEFTDDAVRYTPIELAPGATIFTQPVTDQTTLPNSLIHPLLTESSS